MISNGFLSIAFPDRLKSIKKRNFCLSLEFLDVEEKRLIGRVYKNGNERTFVEDNWLDEFRDRGKRVDIMQFILPILDSILLYRVFTIIPSSRSTPLSSSYSDINTSLQHARMHATQCCLKNRSRKETFSFRSAKLRANDEERKMEIRKCGKYFD